MKNIINKTSNLKANDVLTNSAKSSKEETSS